MLEREHDKTEQDSPSVNSDVLTEAVSTAGLGAEIVITVMRWLEGLILEDRYVRLDQIGHDAEGGISLAQVFVDLPVEESLRSAGTNGPNQPGFVREALSRGPQVVSLERRVPSPDRRLPSLDMNCKSSGFALVGGPGQGKTTVTQFLCQIHRAALLVHRKDELRPATCRALEGMLGQCGEDGLALPTSGAIPWAVVLRDFAPWLERTEYELPNALTEYLAEQVNRVLEDLDDKDSVRMTAHHVRQLIRNWPSVLVLDGLDEVPDLDIREAVLGSIRHFLQDMADTGAKSLIVATTRPQGYRDEFVGLSLEARQLEHLTPEIALHYAERLVRARYHDRPDKRRKILDRLRHASQEESTARLLRSPLQVTLMATLVERIGRAPTERWALFSDYYKIIYDREMERGGPLSPLLQKYRSYIDRIHSRVGLLLQVESETAEGSGALMGRARLEAVVDAALAEEGIGEEEREQLSRQILQATTDRIVLLVQARKDEYGFEIRSLQEFMAACELTNATKDESTVDARLMQIARASSFRNVFLFAASKAFTEMSRLRDVIVERICPALNAGSADEALHALRAGSILALEMLEEGSVLNQPKYARRLMELACELLERPPSHHHARLARVCDQGIEIVLQKALKTRLEMPQAWERRAAWVTLLELVDTNRGWPEELANAAWPNDGEERRNIVLAWTRNNHQSTKWGGWIRKRLQEDWADFSPQFFLYEAHLSYSNPSATVVDWLDAWTGWRGSPYADFVPGRGPSDGMAFHMNPVAIGSNAVHIDILARLENVPAAWESVVTIARFAQHPSASALRVALLSLSAHFDLEAFRSIAWKAPWPLAACLSMAKTPDNLRQWSELAGSGRLGDTESWTRDEERWRANGVDIDFLAAQRARQEQDLAAFPWCGFVSRLADPRPDIRRRARNMDLFSQESDRTIRSMLAGMILQDLESSHDDVDMRNEEPLTHEITLSQFVELCEATDHHFFVGRILIHFIRPDSTWADEIDRIGKHFKYMHLYGASDSARAAIPLLVDAYRAKPLRWGLLHVLATFLQRLAIEPQRKANSLTFDLPIIEIGSIDVPHLRQAAVTVSLGRADLTWPDIAAYVEELVPVCQSDHHGHWEPLSVLEASSLAQPLKERALLLWRSRIYDTTEVATALTATLGRVARRKSNLDDPSTWDRLFLPLPRPRGRRKTVPPPPAASPQIETLLIKNLRIFDSFELEIEPRDDGLGQWIVFLGRNGVGKTTLLRALVFALADDATVTALLQQSYAQWCRHAAEKDIFATMVVKSRSIRFLREIEQGPEREMLRRTSDPPFDRPFIFAYGCRRGSALGGPDRSVAFTPLGAVATLFDEPTHLVHAETWLKGRALAATQNEHEKELYEAIVGALRRALGVNEMIIENDQVWVEGKTIGKAPLSALSDGYLTTAGWMIDLIARWIERARHRDPEQHISPSFIEEMNGIVLIDEIDLHLHPRWQCEIIRTTRDMFKRMTFIVTTHNPLTLLGTQPGEVFVLQQSESNGKSKVKAELADLPNGVRADQILTGPWFGLESTLDPDTLGLFKEHMRILQNPEPSTDERRKEIEGILRKRLGSFADTALERLALGVAAEIMDEEHRELTPKDRENLRGEVLRLVKQRRAIKAQSS